MFKNEMLNIKKKKTKSHYGKKYFYTTNKKINHKFRGKKIHKYSVAPNKTIYFTQLCIALSYIILRSAHREH